LKQVVTLLYSVHLLQPTQVLPVKLPLVAPHLNQILLVVVSMDRFVYQGLLQTWNQTTELVTLFQMQLQEIKIHFLANIEKRFAPLLVV
jgi:hypothetical protein